MSKIRTWLKNTLKGKTSPQISLLPIQSKSVRKCSRETTKLFKLQMDEKLKKLFELEALTIFLQEACMEIPKLAQAHQGVL